ncbi:hypothetical protein FQA39_LY01539 [Lamprigera yunnana]|nr:hypothetical protein FQA39_LY01539 [Lamprigera yunnana]
MSNTVVQKTTRPLKKISFLSTWQTVNDHPLKEIAQVVLRELFIYITFVVVVAYYALLLINPSMFYHYKLFEKIFVESSFESVEGAEITLNDVYIIGNIWKYLERKLFEGSHWDLWPNNSNNKSFAFENAVLGVPRLRQLRVKEDNCTLHPAFDLGITSCYAAFSSSTEDTTSFGTNNVMSVNDLGSITYHGEIASYHGKGFVVDLLSKTAGNSIDELKRNLWISRQSRVVFLEFTVYNPNVNLFCIAKIIFEIPPTGGVVSSYMFHSVNLNPFVSVTDYVIVACQIVISGFIIFYTIITCNEIRCLRGIFFYTFWNWITLFNLLFGYLSIFVHVAAIISFQTIKGKVFLEDTYVNLEIPAELMILRNDLIGLFVFLTIFKMFKYLAVSKTMGQLNNTFDKCLKDIFSFFTLFVVILFAFSLAGHLLFGAMVAEFKGLGGAMFTLFRTILGDFDYDKISNANYYLAPLFFISFIFVVFFILLNMFLAIINDAYADVQTDILVTSNDTHLYHHMQNSIRKLFGRAEVNSDPLEQTPYEESLAQIRVALQKCGFKELEIDMFFKRYNIDPTATVGKFDVKELLSSLETTPYDVKDGEDGGLTLSMDEYLM